MPTSIEDRKKQYRTIYELLSENPRISVKDMARVLQVDPRTASRRMKEAYDLGYISKPQIRKRSFSNLREYVYFVNCAYPFKFYEQYSQRTDIIYHAVIGGFANLWVISREKIDIEGDIITEGFRSDYYTAFAPNYSWKRAIQIKREKVETFNKKEYEPEGIIKTHLNEPVPWDAEDEALYRYFKLNLRKPFTPVMKEHLITTGKIYKWFSRLPECCTISTRYLPEGALAYDPYLFVFETDYKDFIIDLFSVLPTSSFFFEVSHRLFLYTNVDRFSLRMLEPNVSDVSQLHIPLIVDDLLKKGILKSEAHAMMEYAWAKQL